jgi:hypothetical protein
LPIFCGKIGVFLEKQCFHPTVAKISGIFNKHPPIFSLKIWRKHFKIVQNVGSRWRHVCSQSQTPTGTSPSIPGDDVKKLHFGRKIFGQKFYPRIKTPDKIYRKNIICRYYVQKSIYRNYIHKQPCIIGHFCKLKFDPD